MGTLGVPFNRRTIDRAERSIRRRRDLGTTVRSIERLSRGDSIIGVKNSDIRTIFEAQDCNVFIFALNHNRNIKEI